MHKIIPYVNIPMDTDIVDLIKTNLVNNEELFGRDLLNNVEY